MSLVPPFNARDETSEWHLILPLLAFALGVAVVEEGVGRIGKGMSGSTHHETTYGAIIVLTGCLGDVLPYML